MPRAKKTAVAVADTKTEEIQVKEDVAVVEKVVEKVEKTEKVKSVKIEVKKSEEKAPVEVKKESKKLVKSTKAPTTMEELLASASTELRVPKVGDVLEGVVTEVNKRAVLVDIAGKTEGVVIEKEFDAATDFIKGLKQGDTISVYVTSTENERGQILLSLRRAAMNQRWDSLAAAMQTGESVVVRGLELNKGGMIAGVDGIRGFIPTSQFSKQYIGKLETLINRPLKVKVIEVDKEKNRLIFSERHVSEADLIAQKSAALSNIAVGSVYEGKVSGVMPFGVFVALMVPMTDAEGKTEDGKVEGLAHISEISWEKVEDLTRLYKVGDTVKVKVLAIDSATGKLNLSIKQLSGDPWSTVAEKYPEGSVVSGVVSRIAPFGVFVTVEPGVDGLIHISKVPAGEEPKPGTKIQVSVEKLEPDVRRMSLGLVLSEVPMGYK